MMNLILITFNGCPNAEKSRVLLAEAGLTFTEVKQDAVPQNHPYLAYSSPTLLEGERIIFGTHTDSAARSCTLTIPNLTEIKRQLGVK